MGNLPEPTPHKQQQQQQQKSDWTDAGLVHRRIRDILHGDMIQCMRMRMGATGRIISGASSYLSWIAGTALRDSLDCGLNL
jgi:hypothetical protein